MRHLFSRPAIYLVIGIGVLALLVSQLSSKDNNRRTAVSELDPFESLENLTGQDLAKLAPSTAPVLDSIATQASPDQMAMVRDEITSPSAYQQTSATPLKSFTDEVQSTVTDDSPFELAQIDPAQVLAPVVDQINAIDESMTVMEFDAPLTVDGEQQETRYLLDDMASETSDSQASTMLTEAPQTATRSTSTLGSSTEVHQGDSLRPRGWRKNPFIGASNDVVEAKPANEDLEIKTSINETLPQLNHTDSVSLETTISTEMNEAEEISTVANFESKDDFHRVDVIPSTEQAMQSVVSAEQHYTDALPIVVGLPDSVAHKAVHNIEYGKSLSRRGAAFAARQEFYSSLRILAQSHDTRAGGTAYTRALRDSIIALKEAEDFIVSDTETQIGLNVDAVVEGHSTKVIPASEAVHMTAIGAMQRYFAFASNQLRVASGQNAVAAEALYCLGKLHTVQAKFGANSSKLDMAKAIVFHQAAMASDASNFRSANELGVLLANSGRLQESQEMLKRSLQIQQLPQAWKNLAVVHQRAGENQLAQLAQQEFLISSNQQSAGMVQDTIRWVEPTAFNQGTPLELRKGPAQPPQAQQPVPQRNASKPTISQRLKSLF